MTRRVAVMLIVLAVAVMGSGATSGVLLGRLTTPRAEAAAGVPATTTAPPGSPVPTPGRGGNPAGAVQGARPLRVSARIVARSEDGLTVRFDASEPVTATVQWRSGSAVGEAVSAGTGSSGSAKLTFTTTEPVVAQVEARAADGRSVSSNPVAGRRLVREVVLEVTRAVLRFSARDRAGMAASFLGASSTPIRPGSPGPVASARPFGFRPVVVTPDTATALLQLQVSHDRAGAGPLSAGARVMVPLPGRGSETFSYSDDVAGVAITLDLRVTATLR
ncbi:MAG TPA: hypothetical protein VF486_05680 [Actinomycetes bacterium]